MLANGHTVVQLMEQLAPKHLAEQDDKIGLQLGSLAKPLTKVLVALDVTPEVVDEAIREEAGLIIAHHAIIYRPLTGIVTDTPAGRLYEKLIKHDIAVYIAHTNLDTAEGGVGDMMADALGLAARKPLTNAHSEQLKKLVVFVPKTHHEAVRDAVFAAGAGWIGNYSHCSFNIAGIGTFRGEEGAKPFIGEAGKLEQAEEIRLETVVPASKERAVVQAMLRSHPYEEVAYDLYTMDLKGRTFGFGRVGALPEPVTMAELAEQVKTAFGVPFVRTVGDPQRKVVKVAVLGGSGGRFWKSAQFAGADVYITGDIDYHTAHDALAAGLLLIDPGHNAEKLLKEHVAGFLQCKLQERKALTVAAASQIDTEVFRVR
ncbi:Nif3-like dinuclear metal center hexameric protein [Paenibacillus cymbidii]|uniref:Nif3-like dinuclear metal center hexameric protein n=1 Tax=Paenibacillus cymbidii TaxID=1639034 RepID=UPI0010810405|nr:Nif3-like dinuclear metal center hexameric protein [Paenibacillus cymbidii]